MVLHNENLKIRENAKGKVSSSMPQNPHRLELKIVKEGLEAEEARREKPRKTTRN